MPRADLGMRVVYAAQPTVWEPRPGLQFAVRLCALAWQRGQSVSQGAAPDEDNPPPGGAGRVRSASAEPLHVGDRVVATVCVGWSRPHDDTPPPLDLVALIGAPLGAALEVMELARRVEGYARLMDAMSEYLCRDVRAARDEEDVEYLAVQLATRALRTQSAAVWLLEPDQSVRYAAGASYRRLPDGQVVPVNDRLVHLASVDLVNLTDASMEPVAQLTKHERQLHFSYLGAPIRRNGMSLGALEVLGESGRRFNPTKNNC